MKSRDIWNVIKTKSKSIRSQTGKQIGLDDYPKQPDTKYKVCCNICSFEYFTNHLPTAKFQAMIHDEKDSHIAEIIFLKGVATF